MGKRSRQPTLNAFAGNRRSRRLSAGRKAFGITAATLPRLASIIPPQPAEGSLTGSESVETAQGNDSGKALGTTKKDQKSNSSFVDCSRNVALIGQFESWSGCQASIRRLTATGDSGKGRRRSGAEFIAVYRGLRP
ncbi:conserved hypothetical protein [Trichinella spiralis]|uniref:hypothetical protein n=1 Tax=Trichinella spiralis TaxID=6334 RepID=UPI0001EFBEFA|nr:conserved hypothetical protein [Trichinella spiralis]